MGRYAGNCVVCYESLGQPPESLFTPHKKTKNKDKMQSFSRQLISLTLNRTAADSELNRNTYAMFLLLHVLKLSPKSCETFIPFGNPATWARTCPRCFAWVKQAYDIHIQLQKLTYGLKKVKQNVMNTLCQSYDGDAGEFDLENPDCSQACDAIRSIFYNQNNSKDYLNEVKVITDISPVKLDVVSYTLPLSDDVVESEEIQVSNPSSPPGGSDGNFSDCNDELVPVEDNDKNSVYSIKEVEEEVEKRSTRSSTRRKAASFKKLVINLNDDNDLIDEKTDDKEKDPDYGKDSSSSDVDSEHVNSDAEESNVDKENEKRQELEKLMLKKNEFSDLVSFDDPLHCCNDMMSGGSSTVPSFKLVTVDESNKTPNKTNKKEKGGSQKKKVKNNPLTINTKDTDADVTLKGISSVSLQIKSNFWCKSCETSYPSMVQLAEHLSKKHNIKLKHTCNKCTLKFRTSEALSLHKKKCKKVSSNEPFNVYACQKCEDEFYSFTAYNRHMKKTHDTSPFSVFCSLCSKTVLEINFNKHMKSEHTNVPDDNDDRSLSCEHCNFECKGARPLQKHCISTHQIDLPVQKCVTCNAKVFELDMDKHMSSKHMKKVTESLITCDQCKARFSYSQAYARHAKKKHGIDIPVVACSVCDLRILRTRMEDHMSVYHGAIVQTNRCARCDMDFPDVFQYGDHIIHHHKEPPPKVCCPECARWFLVTNMKNHMRKHHSSVEEGSSCATVMELHKCSMCESRYKGVNALARHFKKVHNMELPRVKCTMCPEKLLEQNLDEHMRIRHLPSYEDTFRCEFCDVVVKTSARRGHLKQKHFAKFDIDEQCCICLEKYVDSDLFKYHKATVHGIDTEVLTEVTCSQCGFVLKDKGSLQTHMEKHKNPTEHNCPYCELGFSSNGTLERHIRRLHKSGFSCPLCKESYLQSNKLDAHIKFMHPGERPYKCKVCHKSCPGIQALRRHENTHEEEDMGAQQCESCGKIFNDWKLLKRHYTFQIKKGEYHGNPESVVKPPKKVKEVLTTSMVEEQDNMQSEAHELTNIGSIEVSNVEDSTRNRVIDMKLSLEFEVPVQGQSTEQVRVENMAMEYSETTNVLDMDTVANRVNIDNDSIGSDTTVAHNLSDVMEIVTQVEVDNKKS